MVSKYPSIKIDRNKYLDFKKVAENFSDGAELAYEFGYFNAAGVLIIHSAIALADSLTIKFGSVKMKGDSHYDVIALINELIPDKMKDSSAITHFRKLIEHKNLISYSGDIYQRKDYEKLKKHFDRFARWAMELLES